MSKHEESQFFKIAKRLIAGVYGRKKHVSDIEEMDFILNTLKCVLAPSMIFEHCNNKTLLSRAKAACDSWGIPNSMQMFFIMNTHNI